jgi:Acyltransferase
VGDAAGHTGTEAMGSLTNLEPITSAILSEIVGIMGLHGQPGAARLVAPVFRPAARRLADLLASVDQTVAAAGFTQGIKQLLRRFIQDYCVTGAELIPNEGPLLLASNHPAAYDLPILAACLGRDDFQVISSNISIIRCLPAVIPHFNMISEDVHRRMAATRLAIKHLLEGGSLLVFPRGEVEPDPAVSPGALIELERWSHSLELFIRQVPQTRVVVAIVSGVLSPHWFRLPIIRIWKKPEQRQKIAETLQVVQQLLWEDSLKLTPSVHFSAPMALGDLDPSYLHQTILGQVRMMLNNGSFRV